MYPGDLFFTFFYFILTEREGRTYINMIFVNLKNNYHLHSDQRWDKSEHDKSRLLTQASIQDVFINPLSFGHFASAMLVHR